MWAFSIIAIIHIPSSKQQQNTLSILCLYSSLVVFAQKFNEDILFSAEMIAEFNVKVADIVDL